MDRTAEFNRIIATRRTQQLQPSQPPPQLPPQQPKQQLSASLPLPTKRSEFAAAASQIGADTAIIADKLSKLTQLAQSQSLFEDPTVEINELTYIIKQDIQTINSKLATLQVAMSAAKASSAKQRATHSVSVIDSLKMSLMNATKEFQEVLHTRSHNMQLLQSRRDQFSFTPTSANAAGASSTPSGGAFGAPSSVSAGTLGSGFGTPSSSRVPPPAPIFELGLAAPPPGSSSEGGGGGGDLGGEFGGGGDSAFGGGGAFGAPGEGACGGAVWASPAAKPLGLPPSSGDGEVAIDMSGLMQQQQLAVPVNSTYYDSRVQAVESVQSTIAELGGIFQQLAVMVSAQGEMLQRVDENVEDALVNVQSGNEQLQLYWRNMSNNRGLMMKIFAILAFFIVMWGSLFA